VKLSLSVVLPSGWKVSYLPFGRRGGIPFAIASPERLHGASPTNLRNVDPAKVIDAEFEVVNKEETNNGNKAR
jgi:hypothetical protein